MKNSNNFHRTSVIEFSSADPIFTLQQIQNTGIEIFRIILKDEFTIRFETNDTAATQLLPVLNHYAESYRIDNPYTYIATIVHLLHRPIFFLGIFLYILLMFFLPSRILFVEVTGNDIIPTSQIISVAKHCGIRFGSSRKLVRSEEMKNRIIEQLPELEWVGINTYGCVAEISLRERISQPNSVQHATIGSVIAARDGVVTNCTTIRGTQLCKPGQAVKKGQLLVSGYTDCGQFILGTLAQAEILAETNRNLTILTPNLLEKRQCVVREEQQFRLIIGNNLINFNKCSGILPTTCVKIYVDSWTFFTSHRSQCDSPLKWRS